jgi:hypothetical protein
LAINGRPSGGRSRWADLGPAWISAIAALVAALVAAASFFAGRATAPASDGQRPRTTQTTASTAPESTVDSDGPAAGTVLARYTVDVAEGYGIDVADQPQRPRAGIPGDASLTVPTTFLIGSGDGGKLAQLGDAEEPTFQRCVANTRFTGTLNYLGRGDSFCYSGRGFIAGVKIKDKVSSVNSNYLTLDLTVWKAP